MRIELALQTLHTVSSQRQLEILSRLDQVDRTLEKKISSQVLACVTNGPSFQEQRAIPVGTSYHGTVQATHDNGNRFAANPDLTTIVPAKELLNRAGWNDTENPTAALGDLLTGGPSKYTATSSTISFTVYRASRCDGCCECRCHSRQWLRTPQLLKNLFGIMFVGYSGLLIPRPKCSETTCHKPTASSLRITYCFPQWFLAKAIYIMVTMTRAGDPSFGLTVRRRIEYSSESLIFMIATAGNLEGIKWLLQSKSITK